MVQHGLDTHSPFANATIAVHREYARMVADITGAERAAAARSDPSVLGYRESVGFGLNTAVTAGVLFMLFYFAGKRLSADRGMVTTPLPPLPPPCCLNLLTATSIITSTSSTCQIHNDNTGSQVMLQRQMRFHRITIL